ncbi:MAG: 6-phosphogluconolactonase [Anaerolineales bacterium]|nr:6-phosphogluconolactonase [Anaerolineales bacterium]
MIRVFDNLESISQAAAEIFVEAASEAIAARGRFSVALSGGSAPHRLHEILASESFREQVNWKSVHAFWGDERCVPPDDLRSNFRMARETLLNHVPIPAENIHAVHGELNPSQAAAQYESELKKYFGVEQPVFDLIFLGMGDNAHTASLFPHTPVLNEKEKWVADVYVKELDMYRVTFTAPLINQADQIVFLVSGVDKAHALHEVIEGAYHPQEVPAQLIRHPLWLVDQAASHKLAEPAETELAD